MFSYLDYFLWYISSPEQISFCLRILMPEVMIVILMTLISAAVGVGLVVKGIQLGICFYYYFKAKLQVTECIVLDTQVIYLFILIMILILLSKIYEKLFRNLCKVCGRRITNPYSRSHIESAFHQEKLGRRVFNSRRTYERNFVKSDLIENNNNNNKKEC